MKSHMRNSRQGSVTMAALWLVLAMAATSFADLPFPQDTADSTYMFGDYQVWVYTNTSGTITWHVPPQASPADVLIVAGGGAGGGGNNLGFDSRGGGGGAGGLILLTNIDLTESSYSLTVGVGGSVGRQNGANSTFGTNTAVGGGYGGCLVGGSGGSGGGGSGYTNQDFRLGGEGTNTQGRAGGRGRTTSNPTDSQQAGGGGGGWGEAGADATIAGGIAGIGGNGGYGFDGSPIFGTSVGTNGWFAGGGGGGSYTNSTYHTQGSGGQGGGGNGALGVTGGDAWPNTGGGGGGVRNTGSFSRVGRGADGIVLIRAKYVPPRGTAVMIQ